jgi:hypothetical protein
MGEGGLAGPPGPQGEEGPSSPDTPPANAANTTLLGLAVGLNALIAILLYYFLKYTEHLKAKKAGRA